MVQHSNYALNITAHQILPLPSHRSYLRNSSILIQSGIYLPSCHLLTGEKKQIDIVINIYSYKCIIYSIRININTHVNVYIYIHIYICVNINTYVNTYIYIHTNMYKYIYVYVHIHTI